MEQATLDTLIGLLAQGMFSIVILKMWLDDRKSAAEILKEERANHELTRRTLIETLREIAGMRAPLIAPRIKNEEASTGHGL